jgi:hypothetical protein
MKSLLAKLFKRRVEDVPPPAPEPKSMPTATAPSKRRYGKGKRRHPAPKGARRIDPNGPIIRQVRGE